MESNCVDVSVVIISKDEGGLVDTLAGLAEQECAFSHDVTVVDASAGRLDALRERWPDVRWIAFAPVPGKAITIPEQRNVGVRASDGMVIAFVDSGCRPVSGWLQQLAGPIVEGDESVTVGSTTNRGAGALYVPLANADRASEDGGQVAPRYVDEAPTINLAFTRAAYDGVGGFDERFEYGSDIDFTWRLRDGGWRLRLLPAAEISHDWGSRRRQLKRAFAYGRARARLYHKHLHRWRQALRQDPLVVVYPVFLLAFPLTVFRRFRFVPLLLLVPLWRARRSHPWLTVADHLSYGAGALSYVAAALSSVAGPARRPPA